MNKKHLAALLVAFLVVVLVQGAMQARNRLNAINNEVRQAEKKASAAEVKFKGERDAFVAMEKNSASMLKFLDAWAAAFAAIDSQEAGELNVTSRIKQSGLIILSQRFEVVSQKNETIPKVLRVHVTFEGDYVKALNWLGRLEEELAASRVPNLKIVRGETGNDIKLTLVVDLPLVQEEALTGS